MSQFGAIFTHRPLPAGAEWGLWDERRLFSRAGRVLSFGIPSSAGIERGLSVERGVFGAVGVGLEVG